MEKTKCKWQNSKEWRRFQALTLMQQGWKQSDVAEALDVSQGAVSQWLSMVKNKGPMALRSKPYLGATPKLTWNQKRLIPDLLWHGAESYGLAGEFWSCDRVALVIDEEFGVRYSKSQVSRILKALGWSPQIPITRALQRDEQEIKRWREEVWPALKKQAKREHKLLIFIDESGFYLLPGKVKSYAPKGCTPQLHNWQTRDHLSVMGAISIEGKLYTLVRQESLNGLHTVEFLMHVLHMINKPLMIIWDGSPIHRRKEVEEFVSDTGKHAIQRVRLPAYAPDLNPVEWLWQHLKHVELRNRTCIDLEELHMLFHVVINRVRKKKRLLKSFFVGAGLDLNL